MRNSVVRPGSMSSAEVAVTSFASSAFAPFAEEFFRLYESYGRTIPPLSWKRLSDATSMRDVYRAAGITAVEIHHEPLGHVLESSLQWWDVLWNAGFRGLLEQLTDFERTDFRRRHLDRVQAILDRHGAWLDTAILCAIGVVD